MSLHWLPLNDLWSSWKWGEILYYTISHKVKMWVNGVFSSPDSLLHFAWISVLSNLIKYPTMGMLIDPLMDVCHSFVDNDYLWTPSIYFDLDSLASYEMVISVGGSFGNWDAKAHFPSSQWWLPIGGRYMHHICGIMGFAFLFLFEINWTSIVDPGRL